MNFKAAKTALCALAAAGLLFGSWNLTLADGQSSRKAAPGTEAIKVNKIPNGSGTRGIGTIQYDNDTPLQRNGADGGTVGNSFPFSGTHSVATVSFGLAGNYAGSVVMTIWDVNAGSAVVLTRNVLSGVPQTPSSGSRFSFALTSPVTGHTGTFIAGIRNTDYSPCSGNTSLGSTCDGVIIDNGAGGENQAARINFTSGPFVPTIMTVATSGQSISNNAIFRVTGDNLPVELMRFSVE